MIPLREFLTTFLHEVALRGLDDANAHACLVEPKDILREYADEQIRTVQPITDSVHWLMYWAAQTTTPMPRVYADGIVTEETAEDAVELVRCFCRFLLQSFPSVPLPGTVLERRTPPPRPERKSDGRGPFPDYERFSDLPRT